MRKKILYIHHGGFKGGAPRSLAFLINELDKEKYEPYVAFYRDFDDSKALFESVGAKVIRAYIGGWNGSTVCPVTWSIFTYNIKHIVPTYVLSKKVVKEINPDLIHLNSTCLCFAAKSIKRSFPEIPILCHVREPLQEGFWGEILRKNCNKYVDQYVAIEEFDAKSMKTSKPTDVIYNFVDFDTYNENARSDILREELKLTQEDKILLYLARIQPANGALEMVNSLKEFLKGRSNIHLCIVGADADNRSDYFQQLKAVCTDIPNVHILNFRTDVPQVIASSDIMLVPFQAPHFARSIIEAGAMGVPTVASNIGGVDELVVDGETGYLVDPQTLDGMDRCCAKLLDNPTEYNRVSRNAINHARGNFDAKINAMRTFKVYEEMLKNTGGGYKLTYISFASDSQTGGALSLAA